MSAAHVELSTRALADLRRLDLSTRLRVDSFIQRRLRPIPPPPNLDMKALQGKPPWLRVRVGDMRLVCRRLTSAELAARRVTATHGYLIVRIVHRRDLEHAVAAL